MASPQLENGYVRIANEILEVLAKTNLKGSEHALIFAIMRKTYGFNKKEDAISISQLEEMLGLSKRTIIYNIQNLEAKKVLIVKREKHGDRNEVNVIGFNKDYDMWVVQNCAPQVKMNRDRAKVSSAKLRNGGGGSAKLGKRVVQNSDENVKSFAPTIDTIQKTYTKDIAETSSAKEIPLVIDAFKDVNPSYSKYFNNTTQRKACERLLKTHGLEPLLSMIAFLPKSNASKFAPKITTPLQFEDKLGLLKAWVDSEKGESKGKRIISIEDIQNARI